MPITRACSWDICNWQVANPLFTFKPLTFQRLCYTYDKSRDHCHALFCFCIINWTSSHVNDCMKSNQFVFLRLAVMFKSFCVSLNNMWTLRFQIQTCYFVLFCLSHHFYGLSHAEEKWFTPISNLSAMLLCYWNQG